MWRVKDWDRIFENSQSKKYANISWVPIPNKHDSDGYTQLIEHDHGVSHYGAWILLVQVASKCKPRGTLIRDGDLEHDVDSLARVTRVGAHVFWEAIPRFVKIGWLEEVDESETGSVLPKSGSTLERTTLKERKEQKEKKERKEQKEKKEKNSRPAGKAVGFLEEWDSENWQKARTLANGACRKLWPNRQRESKLKPQDRQLIGKAAYLAVTRLSEAWFQDALEETVRGNARKLIAFFKTCLWKKPRSEGLDLNAMLDAVVVPATPQTDERKEPAA